MSVNTLTRNGSNGVRENAVSEKTWKRNTSGMVDHAHRRREETLKRVEQVIDQLLKEEKSVTFNAVAKGAHVSKAYLYSQLSLRGRIEALREQAQERRVRSKVSTFSGKTDASKDLVILAKERRIKELETENQKLKQELKIAWGKIYERI